MNIRKGGGDAARRKSIDQEEGIHTHTHGPQAVALFPVPAVCMGNKEFLLHCHTHMHVHGYGERVQGFILSDVNRRKRMKGRFSANPNL